MRASRVGAARAQYRRVAARVIPRHLATWISRARQRGIRAARPPSSKPFEAAGFKGAVVVPVSSASARSLQLRAHHASSRTATGTPPTDIEVGHLTNATDGAWASGARDSSRRCCGRSPRQWKTRGAAG